MAPLTRSFTDNNLVPTQQMADYYAKRAEVGLIVSEAIETKKADLVAIGRPFITNPDWIKRIKTKSELVEYDVNMLTQLI